MEESEREQALIQENRTLREEIASLRLAVTRAHPTFEGRTAAQWAGYARRAEADVLSLRSTISTALAALESAS